jgi:uncharacterized protein YbjT (DUF2867 family)
MSTEPRIIAVAGATGQQGKGVVEALKQRDQFRVRALTRNPGQYSGTADEAFRADLNDSAIMEIALKDVYGLFLVTNFWEQGTDEVAQVRAAVKAAKAAGVQHIVWSTLPNVESISNGKYNVPHFTGKAEGNSVVSEAGFHCCTFVEAPGYYQNYVGVFGPQPMEDGSNGWAIPMDPNARVMHMGDISELGNLVAGAFEQPEDSNGRTLSLSGDQLSYQDIVDTLNSQGHDVVVRRVPREVYETFYPGAEEMAAMMAYWEEYTYMGPNAEEKINLANRLTVKPFTNFATWAKENMPAGERTTTG